MLPARWQDGVWGVQKGAETELGVWPAHSTDNDPGKQGPSPVCVQVRVFTDHRPWTSSLGAPFSRKIRVLRQLPKLSSQASTTKKSWSQDHRPL